MTTGAFAEYSANLRRLAQEKRDRLKAVRAEKAARTKKEAAASQSVRDMRAWVFIRKAILARDSWACRICAGDGDGAALNVHHIDSDRTNNDPANLVTLCAPCHRAVHRDGYKPILYEDWPIPWGEHPVDGA